MARHDEQNSNSGQKFYCGGIYISRRDPRHPAPLKGLTNHAARLAVLGGASRKIERVLSYLTCTNSRAFLGVMRVYAGGFAPFFAVMSYSAPL